MAEIRFTDEALDDLRRIGPSTVPRILKKLLILETDVEAGYPLGDELTGFRKLVVGRNTWRIVYRVQDGVVEICEVWAVGERADAEVYDKAVARVRAAATTRPHLLALVDVMERLGKLASGIEIANPPPPQPVPDWLAQRLIYTVGLPREVVAAMDLQQAVDRWGEHTSRTQP
ncbi:type II toxin-antitoxin system RelE/ParE family toxin [Dactylosporangium sp. NPDC048998]|uniref:type II toxin-antitoxin system RelE family toxin n=1 Tax=Dactylosporangium sp. NPDC048998 TaxID=3363976 RepID=UPI00371FDF0E